MTWFQSKAEGLKVPRRGPVVSPSSKAPGIKSTSNSGTKNVPTQGREVGVQTFLSFSFSSHQTPSLLGGATLAFPLGSLTYTTISGNTHIQSPENALPVLKCSPIQQSWQPRPTITRICDWKTSQVCINKPGIISQDALLPKGSRS